ncbi:MAG TPA: AAA family ATPase [Candidatus Sumerlaeota bacterium]|nr:AAA family ATPase [Candidatus Sumerlaeota bacterium]HMZ52234.1 AAA family ATPase [Candidatus Sumerlaeota bacterium]HNM46539.1 AAA family ATPase [Candidatus Sumerlaeota bacterium]
MSADSTPQQPTPAPRAVPLAEAALEIELLIRARYPLLAVLSWEEERVMTNLNVVSERLNKSLFEWSITRGLVRYRNALSPKTEGKKGTKDPVVVLREILDITEPAIVVLKDFDKFFKESAVRRGLRDLAQALRFTYVSVIILSPSFDIPPELEKDLTIVDFPLPTITELEDLLERIELEVRDASDFFITKEHDERHRLLEAALGLTLAEAENVFAKTLVKTGRLTPDEIPIIFSEKRQIVRKKGLLEYVDVKEKIDDIGGLDNLKHWLVERRLGFTDKARAFGLPAPKGLLMMGVQGCGKSLSAKAVAALYGMPLLRLDMGVIFNSYVGESESQIRQALRLSQSVSPCVLWIDEIDKGLAGLKGSGSADSGTTQRVFGTLVTWMQENTKPVFVVATANNISVLPPEVLRKGRFDEIFFIDLPNADARERIFAIHLNKIDRDAAQFDIKLLSELAEGFSGAEIEAAVIAGLFHALHQDRELETGDIVTAIRETFPLSNTMREEIKHIREWAKGRARNAST